MMTNDQIGSLKKILLWSGIVLLAMLLISSYAWTQIPAGEEVCTHWNAAGDCDQYGGKFMGIFFLPIVAAVVVCLLSLLPRLEPRTSHIAQSFRAYTVVWGAVLLFFLILHVVLILNILGVGADISSVLPLLIGFLFIFIGNYMGKVRSNFFFGIRTPWTLSSELSWNKTHRLGGKLFVLLGLLFVISAFFLNDALWVYGLVGCIFAMLIVLMVYSYVVWKRDPDVRTR